MSRAQKGRSDQRSNWNPSQVVLDQSNSDLDLDWIMELGPADSTSNSNVMVSPEERVDNLLSSVDLSFLIDCPDMEQWLMEVSTVGDL